VGSYKINPECSYDRNVPSTHWLTVEEAAKYFSVSKTTIYGWIKKGIIRRKSAHFGGAYIVDVNSMN